MSERNALSDLIRRGRVRQVRNLLVEQASFATVLALGGAILLLLVGTQILNWYWPVILFAGSLAIGAYRARTRVLSPYQVAQSIDRRLDFHDALSTAYFFRQNADRGRNVPEFVEEQRAAAENIARTADVRIGVPFFAPRTLYINLGLALAVVALFGIRFGINRSMDLSASLVPIPFEGFLGPSKNIADAKKGQRPFDGDGHRENGMPVDPWQSKPGDLDPAPDSALQTVDTPEVNNPDGGSDAKADSKATGKDQQQTPGEDPLEGGDKGDSSQAGNDQKGDQNSSPDGGQQQGKQPSDKNGSQSPNSGENSSLSDKMRDALANLMAKLKMQPKNSDGKQGGTSSQQTQQQAQKQGQSQDPNSSSQQQQSDANAQAQGQQSQNAQQQMAQGKSDGKSSEKSNSPDGKSGIGKQDGDKTAREAEQLAAMGKISEIIGRRTANVTGEVMVEVASGKQQLRTQYTQRKAAHGEAGGEINRDEVPLAYQQYVQQYFEEIRKIPAAKTKPDSKGKSGN